MFLLARKVSELSPEDIELIKEAAGALARCGEKLEKALRQLRSAEELLDLCPNDGSSSSLEEAIEQYKSARRKAETARYQYIVQREAVGFRNHKFPDRIYPLPPPRDLSRLETPIRTRFRAASQDQRSGIRCQSTTPPGTER